MLRKAHPTDRDALVELSTDPKVRAHLGGPHPREAVERRLDETGTAHATSEPGSYVIADKTTDEAIGLIDLDRRPAHRPGHVVTGGGELELSSVLRRPFWGAGLAAEATAAVLRAAAAELPDQPVLIVTQTARALAARLGFDEVDTFPEFDAQQTLAVAALHAFRSRPAPDRRVPGRVIARGLDRGVSRVAVGLGGGGWGRGGSG
ncbi:Protein N-acetyltransferase, RimJ/RimL family [Actinokineospora terrae]|uniref:Protein N-acetyltransferase, RimJ/RimL family n=1 Tax=Actinokineospora terrae TaxID=155974 RepID=A0A1H9XHI9_9PSEU|nr:Protein N-acetyltransferase, RimJ/RimL family [Actinokineospora terrae]